MCVVAAKYLKDTGWVGIKNRDRNYKPEISLIQSNKQNMERLLLRDELTGYTEGLNEFGICILSAATLVKDDENEIRELRKKIKGSKKQRISAGEYVSKDGTKLRTALLERTIKGVISKLKELRPLGNHLVFNQEECYIVEIDISVDERKKTIEIRKDDPTYENPTPDVDIKVKKISQSEIVVRTNHGIFIDHAGYQDDLSKIIGDTSDKDFLDWMQNNRESSEKRYDTVFNNLKDANSIETILSSVSDRTNSNPQLNPLRTASRTDKKSLRTTGQIILIPSKLKMIYRSIWSTLNDTFNKVNLNNSKTYIDILSYEEDIYEKQFDLYYTYLIEKYTK